MFPYSLTLSGSVYHNASLLRFRLLTKLSSSLALHFRNSRFLHRGGLRLLTRS